MKSCTLFTKLITDTKFTAEPNPRIVHWWRIALSKLSECAFLSGRQLISAVIVRTGSYSESRTQSPAIHSSLGWNSLSFWKSSSLSTNSLNNKLYQINRKLQILCRMRMHLQPVRVTSLLSCELGPACSAVSRTWRQNLCHWSEWLQGERPCLGRGRLLTRSQAGPCQCLG